MANEVEQLTVSEISQCVSEIAQQYGAQKVSLFGSYARGEETSESDVDLLLDKGRIKGMQVLKFQEALEQKLGRKVNVATTAERQAIVF